MPQHFLMISNSMGKHGEHGSNFSSSHQTAWETMRTSFLMTANRICKIFLLSVVSLLQNNFENLKFDFYQLKICVLRSSLANMS